MQVLCSYSEKKKKKTSFVTSEFCNWNSQIGINRYTREHVRKPKLWTHSKFTKQFRDTVQQTGVTQVLLEIPSHIYLQITLVMTWIWQAHVIQYLILIWWFYLWKIYNFYGNHLSWKKKVFKGMPLNVNSYASFFLLSACWTPWGEEILLSQVPATMMFSSRIWGQGS